MKNLEKNRILEFLKDLTELSNKHNIIIFDDYSAVKKTYTPMKGLQMGWNNDSREYSAIDTSGEHLLSELVEEAEIVNESIANTEEPKEESKGEEKTE